MTDQEFSEETFAKIKATILAFDQGIVPEIYAISFHVSYGSDDPRTPMLTVSYNTIERWKACTPAAGQEPKWPIASGSDEAKWNYAFWLPNEELIIGGHNYIPVYAWVRNSPHYYTDEQQDQDYEQSLLLGEEIKNSFAEIVISHAQMLHKDGTIATKFGKDIPIIVHELQLQFLEKAVTWTHQANPKGLTTGFENWVASLYA